jgi:hypothetical protein
MCRRFQASRAPREPNPAPLHQAARKSASASMFPALGSKRTQLFTTRRYDAATSLARSSYCWAMSSNRRLMWASAIRSASDLRRNAFARYVVASTMCNDRGSLAGQALNLRGSAGTSGLGSGAPSRYTAPADAFPVSRPGGGRVRRYRASFPEFRGQRFRQPLCVSALPRPGIFWGRPWATIAHRIPPRLFAVGRIHENIVGTSWALSPGSAARDSRHSAATQDE